MIKHSSIKTKFIALSSSILFLPIIFYAAPAKASFGDFLLGAGVAVGAGAIIQGNNRARQERYRPVPPQQEFNRGLIDGMNRARYDNPRNSPDYTRGYQEGLNRR